MSFTPQNLTVPKGGTADVTLTNHGVLIGQGTSAVAATAAGTTGQVLTATTGADPAFAALPATAPVDAQYVTLATNATLTNERVLTGTASQVIVTDGGAGSTVTLSVGADLAAIAGIAGTGIAVRTGSGAWTSRSIQGTTDQISVANTAGAAGNPTISISNNPVLPGTASVTVPIGTTAQRSGSPVNGMLRYNSDTALPEMYVNGSWQSVFTGAGGIQVVSLSVVFGDIAVAATSTDIALHTIPANCHLIAAAIETLTAGDTVATLNLSAGWFSATDTIGNYDGLIAAPNAATTTVGNTFLPVARAVRFYATSTGGNLNTMTQGSWTVHLSYIQY